jgi:transposase
VSKIKVFMTKKRVYKPYPRAFKEAAVALVTEQGYSVRQAVGSLSIRSNMLYRCKQELEQEQSGEHLSSDEQAELNRLHRENKRLQMEQAILKQASAFVAKEMK